MANIHKASEEISQWDYTEVIDLLQTHQLGDCIDFIKTNQIDGETLLTVTEIRLQFWRLPKNRKRDFINFVRDIQTNPQKYVKSKNTTMSQPKFQFPKPPPIVTQNKRPTFPIKPQIPPPPPVQQPKFSPNSSVPIKNKIKPPLPDVQTSSDVHGLAQKLQNQLKQKFPNQFVEESGNGLIEDRRNAHVPSHIHKRKQALPEPESEEEFELDQEQNYLNITAEKIEEKDPIYVNTMKIMPEHKRLLYKEQSDNSFDSSSEEEDDGESASNNRSFLHSHKIGNLPRSNWVRVPTPPVPDDGSEHYEEAPFINEVPERLFKENPPKRPENRPLPSLPPRNSTMPTFEERFFKKSPPSARQIPPEDFSRSLLEHIQKQSASDKPTPSRKKSPISISKRPTIMTQQEIDDELEGYIPPREMNTPSPMPINPLAQRPMPSPPTVSNTPPINDATSWFRNVDRSEAARLLMGRGDGAFIFRPSQQQNNECTMVIIQHGNVFNIPIRRRADGKLAMGKMKDQEVTFDSLEDLVSHHRYNELTLCHDTKSIPGVLLRPGLI